MDMGTLVEHLQSVEKMKNAGKCEVCGIHCYTKCGKCGKRVHAFPSRGAQSDKTCFLHLHDPLMFGLCRGDTALLGKRQSDFEKFTTEKRQQNRLIVGQYYRNWLSATLSNNNVSSETNNVEEVEEENDE